MQDPGLPPGCTQRDCDGRRRNRPRPIGKGWGCDPDELGEALIEIALSPYDVACLTLEADGSEPEIERRRR